MIERYFEAGTEINWQGPRDYGQPKNGSILSTDTQVTCPMSTATGSFRFRRGESIVHDWLPYSPGNTTSKALGGRDILSGYMTGCPLVLYHHGNWRVGHIGTVDNEPETSQRVKSSFGNFMGQNTTGFNPSGAWEPQDRVRAKQDLGNISNLGQDWVLGLVTTTRQFYAILLFVRTATFGQRTFVVGGKKVVQPMGYEELRSRLNPAPQRQLPLPPVPSTVGRGNLTPMWRR